MHSPNIHKSLLMTTDIKKKIAFIVRGNLKNLKLFQTNISRYFKPNFEVLVYFTQAKGDAELIIKDLLHRFTIDFIISVGGDGTFNEIVNGLMGVPGLIKQPVLAVFPRGAGNDFARSAGIIESMEHLYTAIESSNTQLIDIIQVRYQENGYDQIRYYHNSFDIGLGGLACQLVNKSKKTWGSNFTYIFSTMKSFIRFKRIALEIEANDFYFNDKVLIAVFNNGKYFGSGIGIAPEADLNDGMINLVIARKINILQFIWFLPQLRKCVPLKHREILYHQTDQCTIKSTQTACPMEFDGEVTGNLPIQLKVIREAVKLIKA